MVEITHFPKKCPHCKQTMCQVRKMYCQWMECENFHCPFVARQTKLERGSYSVAGVKYHKGPKPYTYGYTSR